ncbi:MAG: DUF4199 domain-containing protein [Bacteroidetes bacterium]|nr:DUF4199 domain-containing protein [Bacteroidota bacterium]
MTTKSPVNLGLILFAITMVIFFIVYYFFGGNQYYDITLKVNSFVLPLLYCGVAFVSVRSFWKANIEVRFKDAYKRAFVPMFVGGLLSMISIFLFLNFGDTDAKKMLNYQYVERQKNELDKEYKDALVFVKDDKERKELDQKYQDRLKGFAPERVQNKDMLTFNYFAGYFAVILIFYVVLSFFFGSFFRTRNPETQI